MATPDANYSLFGRMLGEADDIITILLSQLEEQKDDEKAYNVVKQRYRKKYGRKIVDAVDTSERILEEHPELNKFKVFQYAINAPKLTGVPIVLPPLNKPTIQPREFTEREVPFITKTLDSLFGRR